MANVIFLIAFLIHLGKGASQANEFPQEQHFVKTNKTQFLANGNVHYFNGFNAYWLMYMAYDPSTRWRVSNAFQQASKLGMNVARTWAFSDGGNQPLQSAPGSYDEQMFWALDFVISEAKKYRIRVILSFANNWSDFGGKKQYVQWAREKGGQNVYNEDDFFTNPVIKTYYKNHIKSILTRVNKVSGVIYKNDPTIFAWELMNEPRCERDLSGQTLQNWVTEMAAYVKSIDKNHLLEVGLEGFYGESQKQKNPNSVLVGTDFISNNRVRGIDFSTIHIYPDQWLSNQNENTQAQFVKNWIETHIQDSKTAIGKPLLLAEFAKSSKSPGYSIGARDGYYKNIYDTIFVCAKYGRSCSGTIFWQLMTKGMENMGDGYEVVIDQSPSTSALIALQSRRMASLNR